MNAEAQKAGLGPLGMTLFVISDFVTFGVLLIAWLIVRGDSPGLEFSSSAGLQTGCLVLVSIAVEFATRRTSRTRLVCLALAFAAAAGYLVFAWLEFSQLAAQGFVPSQSLFAAGFFAVVGFHFAHVVGGLFVLSVCARNRGSASSVRSGAVYWHFVDAVWLLILAAVYL